jgi:hypothetical protein
MTDPPKPKRQTPFSKGGSHYKPPSGIPARGEGWGGGKSGKPAQAFDAENQPPGEVKAAGMEAAKTAREVALLHAAEMQALMVRIARDEAAPLQTRLDAANKVVDRAEGRPAQAIGGDPNAGPVRMVISWEDGE